MQQQFEPRLFNLLKTTVIVTLFLGRLCSSWCQSDEISGCYDGATCSTVGLIFGKAHTKTLRPSIVLVNKTEAPVCTRALKVGRKHSASSDCRVGVRRMWTCFLAPLTEPDVRLSPHPALHLPVTLSFLWMTNPRAKRPEIIWMICVYWPFETSERLDVVQLGGAKRY